MSVSKSEMILPSPKSVIDPHSKLSFVQKPKVQRKRQSEVKDIFNRLHKGEPPRGERSIDPFQSQVPQTIPMEAPPQDKKTKSRSFVRQQQLNCQRLSQNLCVISRQSSDLTPRQESRQSNLVKNPSNPRPPSKASNRFEELLAQREAELRYQHGLELDMVQKELQQKIAE